MKQPSACSSNYKKKRMKRIEEKKNWQLKEEEDQKVKAEKKNVKRKILQDKEVVEEEKVTRSQYNEPSSLPDFSHLECPIPLNEMPMEEYLDPKATTPLEILSIRTRMDKDQGQKQIRKKKTQTILEFLGSA